MESVLNFNSISPICVLNYRLFPSTLSCSARGPTAGLPQRRISRSFRPASLPSTSANAAATSNSQPPRDGHYSVGDFMTRKEDLHVVKTTTKVGEALEMLVEKRVTGLPVVDDDWKLVGVVSDYDLLALDSISGAGQADTNLFPDVDSTWTTFNEVQKLLSKTNGKVVGDVMTPTPLSVRENTNLEDAARLLLQTKYRRLPVVDVDGKLGVVPYELIVNDEGHEDLLKYWRQNGNTFPTLAKMTRDVLNIQASSTTSESAFSAGRFQIGEHIHSLAGDALEIAVLFRYCISKKSYFY